MANFGDNYTIRHGGRDLPKGWQKQFLRALRKTAVVSRACRAAGVSRSAAYGHREQNPKFAKKWDEALEYAIDELEFTARRISVHGVRKPIFYKDKQIATVRDYPTSLMQFLLRCYRRDKFGDVAPPTNGLDDFLRPADQERLAQAQIPPGAIPALPCEEETIGTGANGDDAGEPEEDSS